MVGGYFENDMRGDDRMKPIYLIAPYYNPDPSIRLSNYQTALKATKLLLQLGCSVYCPIIYGHVLYDLAGVKDNPFWVPINHIMLQHCKFAILETDQLKYSKGCKAEIEYLLEHKKDDTFLWIRGFAPGLTIFAIDAKELELRYLELFGNNKEGLKLDV